MEDADIIGQVQQGDSEAFAVLVRKHHRELLSFVHRLVQDSHLAEDIGQEVFLDAYKALPRFDTDRGTPFMAWLCVIARNRCVSVLRKRGRMALIPVQDAPDLAEDSMSMDERLIVGEERRALVSTLERLEEPFRSTILMSLQGELVEDMACHFGVPAATIKTRLFRAREKLRRLFAASFGGICHERQL
jgi:RNA polymerase sigma-70 factor (ECF subfamily)